MHQNKNQNKKQLHVPVLLDEVLQLLEPKQGEAFLDLTAGYGGHARAVLDQIGSLTTAVLVDRDQSSIDHLTGQFNSPNVLIRHQDFLSASRELAATGQQFDLILADLGVSSPHLNEGDRGFSISMSGPLDMRMDRSQALTAEIVLNSYSQDQLAEILSHYGEEPKAKQIARAIIEARPLKTTDDLASVASKAWPGGSRMHPATRTFQAIRIAVNDELRLLSESLPIWFDLLAPGGRIAIISFHSLEDRIVKKALAEASGKRYDAELSLLNKKPVLASPNELVFNPRARSAKLRAAVKIKNKEREL